MDYSKFVLYICLYKTENTVKISCIYIDIKSMQ